jgi:short-subunit dehydrogenase
LKPLDRQIVVITGASSGIGLATARMAGERGAKLALIARNEEALQDICQELNEKGVAAVYVAADVGDRGAIERAADLIVGKYGRIDTWVNDAGIGLYGTLEETTEDDHRRLFDTNYWGVVNGSLAALRHMKKQGGAIINIGSVASEMAQPLLSAYAASKHAVKGFTESLRMELMRDKAPVSVTLIKPAAIDTPFGPHARNYLDTAAKVPAPAYHPDIVAEAILYAAENPTRSLTVGGAGQGMVWFFNWMPWLAEKMFASGADSMSRDEQHAKPQADALYGPVRGTPRTLGQQKVNRSSSLWTQAQMHRGLLTMIGIAGVSAVVLTRAVRRRRLSANGAAKTSQTWSRRNAKVAESNLARLGRRVEEAAESAAPALTAQARALAEKVVDRASTGRFWR